MKPLDESLRDVVEATIDAMPNMKKFGKEEDFQRLVESVESATAYLTKRGLPPRTQPPEAP